MNSLAKDVKFQRREKESFLKLNSHKSAQLFSTFISMRWLFSWSASRFCIHAIGHWKNDFFCSTSSSHYYFMRKWEQINVRNSFFQESTERRVWMHYVGRRWKSVNIVSDDAVAIKQGLDAGNNANSTCAAHLSAYANRFFEINKYFRLCCGALKN